MYVNFKDNFSWQHIFTFVGHFGIIWYIWIETNTAYMNFNILRVKVKGKVMPIKNLCGPEFG